MHRRLNDFLEYHDVLFEYQFGFCKGKSTHHSLIQIVETIRSCLERNNYGCGIFIDLKKAFDTVNHHKLVDKLEHYGVRETSLDWFKSYLDNRHQFVSFNGHFSDYKVLTCGVPQGSVLGPLLFLIYINDLPNISQVLKFYLFADDTNIFFESPNLADLQNTVNVELKKLSEWLKANKLSLNISKTNFVIFSSINKPLTPVTILIDKKAIAQEEYVKYLGVLIDSKLTFKFHVKSLCKKVSRTIGVMYKLRPLVTQDILIKVYFALVYPFLLYAIHVWGNTFTNTLSSIFKLQKKIVRMITYNDFVDYRTGSLIHAEPLFLKLNILTLSDIFKLQISKFIFDCVNCNGPSQFHSYFSSVPSFHNTAAFRNQHLQVPDARTTTYGIKSIKYTGARIWNLIPLRIRICPSKIYFSKLLCKYFRSKYS